MTKMLNNSKLDLSVFDRMINFITKDECSMKGIIDYEIAKKLGKNEFYIPVFYSELDRPLATIDNIRTDYLQIAKDALNKTEKYMIEQGILQKNIKVQEISTTSYAHEVTVNNLIAYKITFVK